MSTDHSAATARLLVDPDDPVGAVDRRFLGVGVDLAQVAGARFWDPTGGGTDEAAATGGSAPVEPFDFD